MRALAIAIWVAACASAPPRPSAPPSAPPPAQVPDAAPAGSDVNARDDGTPAKPHVAAFDWTGVSVNSDDDARALWRRLAATPNALTDTQAIPDEFQRPLARALLREGNFRCAPVGPACPGIPQDLGEPRDNDLTDPCFRRELAAWAIGVLVPDDVRALRDALTAIVDIPPPEDELVGLVMGRSEELSVDDRIALFVRAWKAGHHDEVSSDLTRLGIDLLPRLYREGHVDAVLDYLSATDNRALFLEGIDDDLLTAHARTAAIPSSPTASTRSLPTSSGPWSRPRNRRTASSPAWPR